MCCKISTIKKSPARKFARALKKEDIVGDYIRDLQNYYMILNHIEDSLVIKEYRSDGKGNFIGGEIICASKVKADHYGLSIRKILGKTDFDLMQPEQAKKALEDDLWVMQNKKPIENINETITYPGGRTVKKSTTKSPVFYESGEIRGVICISRYIEIVSEK